MSLPLAAALLFTLALASSAWGANSAVPGALELYPTYQSIGVRLAYTGDDNRNATAFLEYRRQGAASWVRGMNLQRSGVTATWAASVLWQQADIAYEVRATIVDADGGGSVVGSVRTRREPSTVATGRTWWVAKNGSDSNDGSSGAPLLTIGAAVSRARAGEQVRVRAGNYPESVTLDADGTPTAMIHLVADGPGVVLDGSDPAYLNRSDWRNDTGGLFSVSFTAVTRLVCADTAQRLYRQATVADLRAGTNGVTQGWVIEGGRLYVRLEDGSSPNTHTMHVARHNSAILARGDYWRINGFDVRYYGTSSAAGRPGGIIVDGPIGCVVSNNQLLAIGSRYIWVIHNTRETLIERNLCRDPRIGIWPWAACKAHEEEIQGISNLGGRGNVIRFNTVIGTFDGIDAGSDGVTEPDDTDIHDNLVQGVGDDGIEPEGMKAVNVRVLRNRVNGGLGGISISPNSEGPCYVLFNTFANYAKRAFKFSIGSTGNNWICHNTTTSTAAGSSTVWPTGLYSNNHFRNNIMVGRSAPPVSDDVGESLTGNDFDGDLMWSNGFSILFRWKGVNYTSIAALRTATGFETNGRIGDPMLDAQMIPSPTSLAIDAGVRLPGINDCFLGAGPDIGAGEFCVPAVLDTPDRPLTPAAHSLAMSPSPNPMVSHVRIAFTLPRTESVRLSMHDLAGREVAVLADRSMPAGAHDVTWNGADVRGGRVAAGVYFARLVVGSEQVIQRIVVAR